MAIKKVRLILQKSSYQYTAFGGVRFYKSESEIVSSGTQISANPTSGETQNFLTTATVGYLSNNYYYMPFAFDVNKLQRGTYTDNCYWLTDSAASVYTLTVEFKVPLSTLYKIEFVARPDGAFTNRGIDKPVTVELVDENEKVLVQTIITPTSQVNTVQTLFVPAIISSKILLVSGEKSFRVEKTSYTASYIPQLTSNVSSVGTASASQANSGGEVYKAFDRSDSTSWYSGTNTPWWIQYAFVTPKKINRYGIKQLSSQEPYYPKSWTFEGSNDGVSWIVLNEVKNFSTWKAGDYDYFDFENETSYVIYRLSITLPYQNARGMLISELTMHEKIEPLIIQLDRCRENEFIKYGMEDVTSEIYSKLKDVVSVEHTLESGKTFEHTVDMSKRRVDKIKLG
ncbi:discoidin domain-containing protein [Paenibacillus amylolyticus]|uniref:discoidin domain-containing protein n=1 Tax=Paenibacillus amylolyticus TaxID=1451 RepID=UPI003EBC487D